MNISSLSWNICWGCMASDESSKKDATAAKLAVYCQEMKDETGKNVCLDNVALFLKQKSYDIISLQESKNWKVIYKYIKNRYSYINFSIMHPSSKTMVDITTFYNKKFIIKGAYIGNLDKHDARPYLFVLFEHIPSNQQFYHVNLHNGHMSSSARIAKDFNSNSDFIKINNGKNVDIIQIDDKFTLNNRPISFTSENKLDIPIIMGGDFNDHGKYYYWQTGVRINKKVLSCKMEPPLTCCTPVKNPYIWLGAPSIIYDVNLRKQTLGVDLDFIFDVTTFMSTNCVSANNSGNKDLNFCSTIDSLTEVCNDDKYRTHEAKSLKQPHFVTDFNTVKKRIMKEQLAFEKDKSEEPYQRYNEILSYYFPWEIFGVEVGGRKNDAKSFYDKIIVERKKLSEYFETINHKKILELTNDLQYEISNPWFDSNNADYLLVKYLKLYVCKKGMITEDFMLKVITDIMAELNKPVKYYEYGRKSEQETFTLFERKTPTRSTKFEVFTQTADTNFLTHVRKYNNFESTLNLSKNENSSFDYNDFCNKNECPLIIRSLLVETQNNEQYGEITIDNFVSEMFEGRTNRDWAPRGILNIVVNPATVILPKTNVVLCSQLFDRDFGKNTTITTPTTYSKYYESTNVGKRTNSYNNDIKFGDYFITSKDVTIIEENTIPAEIISYAKYPTSDHLPVEITFQLNGNTSNRHTKKKYAKHKTRHTRRA
jgi:hypothetical protein